MNAVVKALGIGTRLRAWTAHLPVLLDPTGRPALRDVPFEMIPGSKVRTRWRAP